MVTGRRRARSGESRIGDESGTGLVELVLAAGLGMLGMAVIVAVVRGPLAGAALPTEGRDGEVPALLREVLVAGVRTARTGPDGAAIAAAGPDHVVLRTPADGWWRLTLTEGAAVVDTGLGVPPTGPAAVGEGRVIAAWIGPAPVLVLRDAAGAPLDPSGTAALARTRLVDLAPVAEGDPVAPAAALHGAVVSVGLRGAE